MKIKTSDLEGLALDWAVAKCEGIDVEYVNDGITKCLLRRPSGRYEPSTDWSQGGPIIEREQLQICPEIGKRGCGNAWWAVAVTPHDAYGATPLVAAMRCFVASKLVDEVSRNT